MRNRGLLTLDDRKVFTGEKEPEEGRLSDIRWNVDQRMERIERDLEILREAGEDELVEEFYTRFERGAEMERRIERLEELLEEDNV